MKNVLTKSVKRRAPTSLCTCMVCAFKVCRGVKTDHWHNCHESLFDHAQLPIQFMLRVYDLTRMCSNINQPAFQMDVKNTSDQRTYIWAATRENQQCGCVPSADSDQPGRPPSLISLRCPRGGTWDPWLSFKITAKTLIGLGGSPGWSESALCPQPLCWFSRVAAQLSYHVHLQTFTMIIMWFADVEHCPVFSTYGPRVDCAHVQSSWSIHSLSREYKPKGLLCKIIII